MTQKIFIRVDTEYSEVEVFGDLITAMEYGEGFGLDSWQQLRVDGDEGKDRTWECKDNFRNDIFIVERNVPASQGIAEPGSVEDDRYSVVTKLDFVSSHRTGTLKGLDVADIIKVLGIMPESGSDKAAYDFMFSVKMGGDIHECAIWDYKGSYRQKQWSTFGPVEVLQHLFGPAYISEG